MQPIQMGRSIGDLDFEDIEYNGATLEFKVEKFASLPKAFDYRDKHVVAPVKDQSTCGACFLFGTMAAIESAYMLKYKKQNVAFNEMDLWNCLVARDKYHSTTCEAGGDPSDVLFSAMDRGVILMNQGDKYTYKYKDNGTDYPVRN